MRKGVFWPTEVYAHHFKQPIPRRRLVSHEGKRGIILSSSAWAGGVPDGCTHIFQTRRREVLKNEEVASDGDEVREGQLDDVWAEAKDQVAVSKVGALVAKPSDDGVPTPVKLVRASSASDLEACGLFSWDNDSLLKCGLDDSDETGNEGEGSSVSKEQLSRKRKLQAASPRVRVTSKGGASAKKEKVVDDAPSVASAKAIRSAKKLELDSESALAQLSDPKFVIKPFLKKKT